MRHRTRGRTAKRCALAMKSLLRRCEAGGAVKSPQATTFSACRGNPVTFGTPKAKSLDCRGRFRLPRNDELAGFIRVHFRAEKGRSR